MDKIIRFLFPGAIPNVDFRLECHDGVNTIIAFWNDAMLGPQPTPAQIEAARPAAEADMLQKQIEISVKAHLDSTVKQRGYDSILSCCSYATSGNATFAAEGHAAVVWRDAVWAYCYAQLALYKMGQRPAPTPESFIAELPPLGW